MGGGGIHEGGPPQTLSPPRQETAPQASSPLAFNELDSLHAAHTLEVLPGTAPPSTLPAEPAAAPGTVTSEPSYLLTLTHREPCADGPSPEAHRTASASFQFPGTRSSSVRDSLFTSMLPAATSQRQTSPSLCPVVSSKPPSSATLPPTPPVPPPPKPRVFRCPELGKRPGTDSPSQPSVGTNPADTVILAFQPPEP